MYRSRFLPMILALALAVPGAAGSAKAGVGFTAVLDGPTAGTDSPAVGTAVLVLSDDRTEVAYEITYTGLVGTESGSHFHYGEPGALGPRLLTLPLGTPKIGIWPVDELAIGELEAGRVYINVHTSAHPSGEIRGNLAYVGVPADTPAWGAVKALFR